MHSPSALIMILLYYGQSTLKKLSIERKEVEDVNDNAFPCNSAQSEYKSLVWGLMLPFSVIRECR